MLNKKTPIDHTIFKHPYYDELKSILVDQLFGNTPELTI